MTIDQWLAEATPERREVQVCFDRTLLSRLDAAQKRLDMVVGGQPEKMLGVSEEETTVRAEVAQISEEIRSKTRTLVFEGLGWGAWRELLSQHPPKDDQADVFRRAVELAFMPHSIVNIGFNAETFVPAAMSASCTEPGITLKQAETMLRKAPPGVLERIWTAVLEVNTAGGDDPFVSPNGASVGVPASAKR
jgi:hypothetical protein